MKKKYPKVSVIVAVYNGEGFVKECLASLVSQTFKDFEVVVVNDGSTDKTIDMLVDERLDLNVIDLSKNIGVSAARNVALKAAKGEYIAVLDIDDLWIPSKLEKQVAFLKNNPEYDIVGSFFELKSETGNASCAKRSESNTDIRKQIALAVPFLHSSILVRSNAMERARGYDEFVSHGEDYRFFVRILKSGKGANIPETLTIKRETRAGLTFKISVFSHLLMGFRNRVYAFWHADRSFRGFVNVILGVTALFFIRVMRLNRETLRRFFVAIFYPHNSYKTGSSETAVRSTRGKGCE